MSWFFSLALFSCVCLAFPVAFGDIPTENVMVTEEESAPEGRECNGTHMGMSFSGSNEVWYRRMRRRYSDCTHVYGNLELTHLDNSSIEYDLSFLKKIRYVSGYVLIVISTVVKRIPLTNLQIIRGNFTFPLGGQHYALAAFVNYPYGQRSGGLQVLELPSLQEISHGQVGFHQNPSLGFVDTVNWNVIARHRSNPVNFMIASYNATAATSVNRSACPFGGMWSPNLCQADVPDISCYRHGCDGRCFGTGADQCCHSSCAVGCHGPSNEDCLACKDYRYNSQCVGFCPAMTSRGAGVCHPVR